MEEIRMNEYLENEKVINLKDMLYRTLKLWRKILVGAIIIALLAGLYQVYRGMRPMLDSNAMEELQEKYEITLRDYEATGERLKTNIDNLRDQSANQQEYNEKSVLMKIDPMDKWNGSFQLYIDSKYQIDPNLSYQNIDMTNRLISAYSSFLRSGELQKELLAQIPGIDEIRFLTEIYSVSADPGTATITVNTVGVTESDVQQMLSFVKTKLAEQYEVVRNVIGDHSYEILTESYYSTIDLDLDDTQKNNLLAITEYANKIGETNAELAEWEKKPAPEPEFGTWYTVKQTAKFIILGGIIGVIVMCIWFAVKYIVSDTVKTDDDWKLFGVPVLGRILRDEAPKKFLPGLDRLIDRAFGRVRCMTQEQSSLLAAQNLGAVLKERGISRTYLVGRLPEGQAEALAQKMDTAGAGISFRYAGDALSDPGTARSLEENNEVLLLAERYVTRNADVEQTLTLLKAWGKMTLGVIIVE